MLKQVIEDGSALDKLAQFIAAQGGDKEMVYHPELLPKANYCCEVEAPKSGYVERIICDEVGICSLILGGGRETKESEIDLSVGIILKKKVGDYVKEGDVLAYIYYNDEAKKDICRNRLLEAYEIGNMQKTKKNVILGILN